MTYDQVIAIFDNTPRLAYENRRFAFREGLRVLFDLHDDNDDVSLHDDEMYYGSVERVLDKLTPELCTYLVERGWYVSRDSFNFWT